MSKSAYVLNSRHKFHKSSSFSLSPVLIPLTFYIDLSDSDDLKSKQIDFNL